MASIQSQASNPRVHAALIELAGSSVFVLMMVAGVVLASKTTRAGVFVLDVCGLMAAIGSALVVVALARLRGAIASSSASKASSRR